MRALTPDTIHPPFGAYSHGTEIPAGWRVVRTSGQLGVDADDVTPESVREQADICFDNIRAILAQAGMGPQDVAHISGFVTDRTYFPEYMAARDAFVVGDRKPSSTLLIVSGFTRPEFKVEVEVIAAAP